MAKVNLQELKQTSESYVCKYHPLCGWRSTGVGGEDKREEKRLEYWIGQNLPCLADGYTYSVSRWKWKL